MILLGNLNQKDMPSVSDLFYNEILQTWASLTYSEPSKPEEILKQILWYNSCIKIDNKTVNYKTWADNNINFIQDLLNKDGNFATKNELENKFSMNFKYLEYESLRHAIPKIWKTKIEMDTGSKNMIINKEYKIKINKIEKQITEISTRDIYWELILKIAQRPTSELKWEEKTDLAITQEEWKMIYTMAYRLTRDTKLINFNFKLTHRILAVGEKLKVWDIKENEKCEECNQIDTIEHHLVQCPAVLTFWQQVFNWWENISKTKFPLIAYEIIFGIPNESNEIIINSFNYILLTGNYYIYKSKIRQEKLHLYEFLLECKNRLIYDSKISDNSSINNNKPSKWEDLKTILGIEQDNL
jgi:hypothetical protein